MNFSVRVYLISFIVFTALLLSVLFVTKVIPVSFETTEPTVEVVDIETESPEE